MLYIQDTADALLSRKSDDFKVATGTTQTVSLKQKVDEDIVKGGIGNQSLYTIKSNKELEIEIEDAIFDFQWLAATQGVKVLENDKVTIEKSQVVEITGQGEFTIGDTTAKSAVVVDTDGKNYKVDSLTNGKGAVTELASKAGTNATVIWDAEIDGDSIAIRADRFAEKFRLQLFTYAYDKDTEAISKEVRFVFDNVTPSSEFDFKLKAGDALSPQITLRATADPKTKEIGKIILSKFVEAEKSATVTGKKTSEGQSQAGKQAGQ